MTILPLRLLAGDINPLEINCDECNELSDDSDIVKDCYKIAADLDLVLVDYVDLTFRFVLGRKGDLAS